MRSRSVVFILAALSGCAHVAPAARSGELAAPDASQLLEVARVAERLGDRVRTQQYLLAARKAGADPDAVLPPLLRSYVGDGQYRLAIEVARDHLRSHPRQGELHLLLAELYAATALVPAAIAEYERVLALAPSEARAHYALAALLHDQGQDAARADQHFRAYLALQPQGDHAEEARSLLLEAMP